MLKKITIKGYKSFENSSISFEDFTVVVGKNNVGKSNLFDALRLLSNIAQMPIASAFQPKNHRGDPVESILPKTNEIEITTELDLSNNPHPYEKNERLSHPYLKYSLKIHFDLGLLKVIDEELTGRKTFRQTKVKTFMKIAPADDRISIKRDGTGGGRGRIFPVPSPRSVLTFIDDAQYYPHIVALKRELSSWRFFHFEPEALREPSPAMDIFELESSGRGLSSFYDTLKKNTPKRFEAAERALKLGIPEADKIEIVSTGDRRVLIKVGRANGDSFSARILSDGTLRFLALLALQYAPNSPGLVCFEEPENGIHPGRLVFITDVLRQIGKKPTSQVIVNSHSPYLVDCLEPEEIRFATFVKDSNMTRFNKFENDLFLNKPNLKKTLESGEMTIGELWSQGGIVDES